MILKFKHQKFQEDAAKAVCDVFAGQPHFQPTYRVDTGKAKANGQTKIYVGEGGELSAEELSSLGYKNSPIRLSDNQLLENLQRVQRSFQIQPSEKIEVCTVERTDETTGKKEKAIIKYNLTVEMETGVGKTYTYIKTMYELNKRYGFKKFIVIVPSVAIREGVHKSFQITQDHFAQDYGKKIRFFIYNSAQLHNLDKFSNDGGINVMIINSQAFNARGKDARRIYMKLDSFRSRRPIDVIAQTNPILIIDEPQSTEGKVTKEKLPEFNPLMVLRYSATHRADSIYNMIYRLDALDAYNQQLVKKIAVKGISTSGSTATEGYLYLQGLVLSPNHPPKARIEYDIKRADSARKTAALVTAGYNLFEHSGGLEEYRGYTVSDINAHRNTVEFVNGVTISVGDVIGAVNESQIRRIQIRETIKSHLERERELFYKGIKVLSLFFIDEVAKYRQYNSAGTPQNGEYADIFEEEYDLAVKEWQIAFGEDEYLHFLNKRSASSAHAGYFSIDKKSKRMVDGKIDRREKLSDDVDAYDLIMRDKERLLDMREPVSFIFSHSALREGWDNPNVFQICTLKVSGSDVRKRQEVGRGLRLCVNQLGERMDANAIGRDVHHINVLTVIANESYDDFSKRLQTEIAEEIADRPREVTAGYFENKTLTDAAGNALIIDHKLAGKIVFALIKNDYIDDNGALTEKYYDDKASGQIALPDELQECKVGIVELLDKIYNPAAFTPENALGANAVLELKKDKLGMKEFKALWERINTKTAYIVDFDTNELIKNAISALDSQLAVSRILYKIETGILEPIKSKEALAGGEAMKKVGMDTGLVSTTVNTSIRYDLIGKLVDETGLTRAALVKILKGIQPHVFEAFQHNPEEFIIKVGRIINEQKATAIVDHITYELLEDKYDTDVFTEPTLKKGKLGDNAIEVQRSVYNYVITDSNKEREFAQELDIDSKVAVYAKLPSGFFINTPVGKYNPDWAIAFYEGTVKHIYFVAETKGSLSTLQLKGMENAKAKCAKKHFELISSKEVIYEVVDSYDALLGIVTG